MSDSSLQTSSGTRSESFNMTLEQDATILDIHRKLSKRSAAYILLSASVSCSFCLGLISVRKGEQPEGYSLYGLAFGAVPLMNTVAPAGGDPACLFWAATIPEVCTRGPCPQRPCCTSRSLSPSIDVNGQITRKCLKARDSPNR